MKSKGSNCDRSQGVWWMDGWTDGHTCMDGYHFYRTPPGQPGTTSSPPCKRGLKIKLKNYWFLRYAGHSQTDRQTDRQTNRNRQKHYPLQGRQAIKWVRLCAQIEIFLMIPWIFICRVIGIHIGNFVGHWNYNSLAEYIALEISFVCQK